MADPALLLPTGLSEAGRVLAERRYAAWARRYEPVAYPPGRFGPLAALLGVSVETVWAVEGARRVGGAHPLGRLLAYTPLYPSLWRRPTRDPVLHEYVLCDHREYLGTADLLALGTEVVLHGRTVEVALSAEASWHEPGRTVLVALSLVRPVAFDLPLATCTSPTGP